MSIYRKVHVLYKLELCTDTLNALYMYSANNSTIKKVLIVPVPCTQGIFIYIQYDI